MSVNVSSDDLAHSLVHSFTDTVSLGIARSGRNIFDAPLLQLLNETKLEFWAIVMNACCRPWISVQPR